MWGVDTDANGVSRRALRGPTWFATLTSGSELAENELRWWPHFGGRSTALVLSLRFFHCSTERPMGWSINTISSRCTVFVCEGPEGSVEFALIYAVHADMFRRAVGRR
jgi:hypothetical protein